MLPGELVGVLHQIPLALRRTPSVIALMKHRGCVFSDINGCALVKGLRRGQEQIIDGQNRIEIGVDGRQARGTRREVLEFTVVDIDSVAIMKTDSQCAIACDTNTSASAKRNDGEVFGRTCTRFGVLCALDELGQ